MRLKRLKLHNYCQHVGEHEWHFHGSTVGIIGRNGSGKTNLVRAVSDVTTGSFFKKKEKAISYGESVGSIDCDFDAMDGTRLRIFRSLNKSEATLSVLDPAGNVVDVVANTINGTNEALSRYIPVDPSVMQHIVFAGQEDITGLLFGKTAGKERLAQSFFGVERARQVEKVLGELLASLPAYDDSIATMLSDTSGQIDAASLRQDELNARVFEGILPEDALRRNQMIISRHSNQAQRSGRRATLVHQIALVDAEIVELERKAKLERDSIEGFSIEDIRSRVEVAKADTAINSRIDHLERTIKSWEATLQQAEQRRHLEKDLTTVQLGLHAATADIGRLKAAITSSEGVLEKLLAGQSADCPVCEHEVSPGQATSYAGKIEQDRSQLQVCQDLFATGSEREKEIWASLRSLHADASAAEARIADARTELGTLGPVRAVAAIQPLLNAIRLIEEGQAEIQRLTSSIGYKQAERGPMARSLGEIDAEGEVEDVTQETLDNASSAIASHTEALRQRNESQRELDIIQGQLNSLLAQEGRLTEAYRKQQAASRQRDFITKIRGIFHYSGAPQAVVRSRLMSIEGRVNYYLELLSTPFRVSVQEGLSFLCRFDSKEIDSQELSGGEKVDLSVSFRLAACESFCSNVGFVVLDEPTTWLDENTKHEMVNVLDRLNELGRSNNFQFLIPTHERMLLDHFDQVIQL